MAAPRYELLPVFTSERPEHWGFDFAPHEDREPIAWHWCAPGWVLDPEPGDTGRTMLREPGHAARYAHECYWRSIRGFDFPGFTLGPH